MISLQKEKESLTVHSLTVNSLRNGAKTFVRLYFAIPISNKIGQKSGISVVPELYLWTLRKPYMMPGLLQSDF